MKSLYILLDGALITRVYQTNNNKLDGAFAADSESEKLELEIARLSSGEIVGEVSFLKANVSATTVKTLEKSLVLSVLLRDLTRKLQQDVNFSVRFYRAVAILLAVRLEKIVNQLANKKALLVSQRQEILLIFAQLYDWDIYWMISAGSVKTIPINTILIHPKRPIEALYLLLDGKLKLIVSENNANPLIRAFSPWKDSQIKECGFALISKGDIVGETAFLGASPPSFSVKAVEDSLVLSIPKWKLATKLLQDVDFAARFYRVLAISLADKQQALISCSNYSIVCNTGKSPSEKYQSVYELGADLLLQVSIATNRFDWMLKKN